MDDAFLIIFKVCRILIVSSLSNSTTGLFTYCGQLERTKQGLKLLSDLLVMLICLELNYLFFLCVCKIILVHICHHKKDHCF